MMFSSLSERIDHYNKCKCERCQKEVKELKSAMIDDSKHPMNYCRDCGKQIPKSSSYILDQNANVCYCYLCFYSHQ